MPTALGDESEAAVIAHPARIMAISAEGEYFDPEIIPATATPEERAESLINLAKKQALDPGTIGDDAFFWQAEVSSKRLDSYGTEMQPSSLKNYAAAMTEGRSFQDSHNWRALPIGYSLMGRFIAGQGGGVPRTVGTFYTVRGAQEEDRFIRKAERGLVRDVSIGFSGGRWICSIDGADMRTANWEECSHFPGSYYTVKKKGEKGDTGERVLCIARIEDANLHEVSAVYDGACPGAGILRAQRAISDGMLTAAQVDRLSQLYRVNLPAPPVVLAIPTPTPGAAHVTALMEDGSVFTYGSHEGGTLVPEPTTTTTATPENVEGLLVPSITDERLRVALRGCGFTIADDADSDAALEVVRTETATLRSQAADGVQYRTTLVNEALAEGVRAYGDRFDRAVYAPMLERAEVAQIARMRDDWRDLGDKALKPGRSTRESQEERTLVTRKIPDHVYKSA